MSSDPLSTMYEEMKDQNSSMQFFVPIDYDPIEKSLRVVKRLCELFKKCHSKKARCYVFNCFKDEFNNLFFIWFKQTSGFVGTDPKEVQMYRKIIFYINRALSKGEPEKDYHWAYLKLYMKNIIEFIAESAIFYSLQGHSREQRKDGRELQAIQLEHSNRGISAPPIDLESTYNQEGS